MPVAGEYVLNRGLDHRCDSVVTSVFRNFLCSSEAVCDWLEDWWWADLRFSRIRHWVCSSLFMHSRTMGPEMRGKSRRNSLILSWQTVCSSIRANTPPATTHREWGNGTSKASKVPLVWEDVPPGAWTPKDGSMKMETERERNRTQRLMLYVLSLKPKHVYSTWVLGQKAGIQNVSGLAHSQSLPFKN